MPIKPTSGLPGHTPTRLPDAPPRAAAITGTTTATTIEQGPDPRRSAWLLLAAQVAAGAPVPNSVSISPDGAYTHVTLPDVADVAAWAARIGLPAPRMHRCPSQRTPDTLLRYTETAGRAAGTWLTVTHLDSEPLPDPAPDTGADSTPPQGRS